MMTAISIGVEILEGTADKVSVAPMAAKMAIGGSIRMDLRACGRLSFDRTAGTAPHAIHRSRRAGGSKTAGDERAKILRMAMATPSVISSATGQKTSGRAA